MIDLLLLLPPVLRFYTYNRLPQKSEVAAIHAFFYPFIYAYVLRFSAAFPQLWRDVRLEKRRWYDTERSTSS